MGNLDINAFFETESFCSLDDESKSVLTEFAQAAEGKSQQEVMAAFMACRAKLNIDAEKQRALLEALKAGLSPENKMKFEVMERFIHSYK